MTEVAENTDVLWGAEQIAEYMRRKRPAIFRLLGKGKLPARKIGRTWVATKSELDAVLRGTAPKA